MLSTDRVEFDGAIQLLCSGFRTPPTQARKDAYWRGFSKTTMVEFVRLVDIALEHWEGHDAPTVPELRALKYRQRASVDTAQTRVQADERDTLVWFANRLILRLLFGRQTGFGAQPLAQVRQAVLSLVDWFSPGVLEGDDAATPASFIELLTKAIRPLVEMPREVIADWDRIAALPGSQEPFPAYMARDYQPVQPQLELAP